ncbi:MAG: hypothetical protein ACLTW9_12380 [Enterocloster sp.]
MLELLGRLEGLLGAEKTDMKNYIQILDAGFPGNPGGRDSGHG